MSYNHSLVVVCPDAVKETLLNVGRMLPSSVEGGMSVELSANGSAPVTHWGSHSWVQKEFADIMSGEVVPEIEGVSAQDINNLLASIIVSVDPIVEVDGVEKRLSSGEHFNYVLEQAGLQRISVDI